MTTGERKAGEKREGGRGKKNVENYFVPVWSLSKWRKGGRKVGRAACDLEKKGKVQKAGPKYGKLRKEGRTKRMWVLNDQVWTMS